MKNGNTNNRERFYKSKEWERFRKIVISNRLNDDGSTVCERCGKVIVQKNDIVLHHKTELTDENVDDVSIALNENNIELVCFKCHNKEHDRFNGWRSESKNVYLVYGAPCSGKTTYVRRHAGRNDIVVDMDSIYECVSTNNRYFKPDSLKSVVYELRDKLYEIIKYRNGKWNNAYVIAGAPLKGERERLLKRLGGAMPVFIKASKEECLSRCLDRGEEWKEFINNWFDSYQE